jgi:hypothetical protein
VSGDDILNDFMLVRGDLRDFEDVFVTQCATSELDKCILQPRMTTKQSLFITLVFLLSCS